LDEAADALALVGARVVDVVPLTQRARVDAEENQFPNEWVAPEFEGQRTKFPVVIRRRFHLLVTVGIHPDRGRNIERAGEIIDHGIDEILHALVLEGGTSDDWDELVGNCLAADAGFQHLRRHGFFFEDCFGHFVVEVGNRLDQVRVGFLDFRLVLLGNVAHFVDRAHRVVVEIEHRLAVHNVELALEIIFFP
jgi:hypothetical protein